MSRFDEYGPTAAIIEQMMDDSDNNESIPPVIRAQKISRRAFMKLTGIAGSGLMLGLGYSQAGMAAGAKPLPRDDTSDYTSTYIQIADSGKITLFAKSPEIGQGVKTALPMIVAEELDASWEDVTVVQSAIDKNLFGSQYAGGSTTISSNWDILRHAGAMARTLLTQAAAQRWNVHASECSAINSTIIHQLTGRRLSYAELAQEAATLPLPNKASIKLKSRDQYRLLGQPKSGVDNLALVTGKPLFGIDQQLPNMAYATYQKCPATGGRVKSANLEEIRKLPGVIQAFVLTGNDKVMELMPGVAIVANSTWAAIAAKRKLRVEWDESQAAKDSWSAAVAAAQKISQSQGQQTIVEQGDVDKAFASDQVVEAGYQYAFVSHAQLEPQNCTAWYHDESIELWVPTQTPQSGQEIVANVLGIAQQKVTVHQTRVGGGFGRRLMNDYMAEAAAIARKIDRPVKLQWTREDDMAHDFYRAGGFHYLKGAVNKQGKLSAWQNHFITFSKNGKTPVFGGNLSDNEFPHPMINNLRVSKTLLPWDTPCGFWRAPGANVFAFAMQSFIHEMAIAAGRDHLEFLLDMMGEPRWLDPGNVYSLNTGRARAVIKLAASKAGWGKPLPKGRGLGLAFHFSHAGHIAEVAEVSVTANKQLTVHQVTVVGDVGPIINLSGAKNQCEGSVVDGLSTLLGLEVTHEAGRVQQSNFHQYPMLRMPHTPKIAVHFIESDNPPTGLGEPALPPLAPAVCNAIYAATGDRVRTMPIAAAGYHS